ncbi:MAG TPA: Do family serine endopeptidase [Xanthobacteraceae bacterium]|jgi:serine protease Do|nr:Do family serine endopeptidase [Xanthobacteraceae bacterium]
MIPNDATKVADTNAEHFSSKTQRFRAGRFLAKRRFALLASAAAIGAAVLLAGPGYRPVTLEGTAAHAVEVQPQAGFADLIEKVKPAVISVRVKIEQDDKTVGSGMEQFGDNDALRRFFREFGMPGMPGLRQMPHGRQMITGLGSGFFISADGYAVTNFHVVDHAKTVEIKTDDGKSYTAKVVGTDQKTDLALIKVDAGKDFPFVSFADKPPRVGDWVVAVGNPFGLTGTATAGIVSARGRDIGSGPYDDFIQIDAPINKGNSGGPAFNIEGKVIAVNTAIYSPSGGSVGIGFGIPADTVKTVVAKLKDRGYVERGWIGVKVQAVTAEMADSLGMKNAEGAIVDEAQDGGPAAEAGLQTGDVITAVNGDAVKDSRDLAKKIGSMAPGTKATLSVLRKGAQKTIELTLRQMPNDKQAKADKADTSGNDVPHLGLTLAPADQVAGAGGKGLVITGVDPDGAAAERGLQTGDVILDVGGTSVSNVGQVRRALARAKDQGRSSVLMRVQSGNGTRFVALPLGRA